MVKSSSDLCCLKPEHFGPTFCLPKQHGLSGVSGICQKGNAVKFSHLLVNPLVFFYLQNPTLSVEILTSKEIGCYLVLKHKQSKTPFEISMHNADDNSRANHRLKHLAFQEMCFAFNKQLIKLKYDFKRRIMDYYWQRLFLKMTVFNNSLCA